MTELMRRRRALMAQDGPEDLHLNDILTLDGIKNTRSGHNSSSTKWEDLSGNQHDFTRYHTGSALIWNANHLRFNAEGYSTSATNKQRLTATADLQGNGNLLTVEFVAKFTGHGTYTGSDGDYGVLFANAQDNTPTAGRFLFRTYSNSAFTSVGYSGAYGTTGLVYMGGAKTTRYVAYVFDGSKVTEYRDGTKYDSTSNPKNVTYQSGTKNTGWTLGGSNNNSLYINAEIYRIGISAKVMTATEIAERYQYFKQRFSMP